MSATEEEKLNEILTESDSSLAELGVVADSPLDSPLVRMVDVIEDIYALIDDIELIISGSPDGHQQRITILESRVATQQSLITSMQSLIISLQSEIASLTPP